MTPVSFRMGLTSTLKMTVLHWATEHNHRDVVEMLLKYGVTCPGPRVQQVQ